MSHVIAVYDGSDNWLRTFVWNDEIDGIQMLEQKDVLDYDTDGNTTELTRSFYHRNALGSVMEITDANQAAVTSYRYDPYGNVTITLGGQTQSADPLGQHWGYTGRFHDEESGHCYYRARYYDPATGRFLQRDPLGYKAGPTLFAYGGSSPINAADPSGLLYDIEIFIEKAGEGMEIVIGKVRPVGPGALTVAGGALAVTAAYALAGGLLLAVCLELAEMTQPKPEPEPFAGPAVPRDDGFRRACICKVTCVWKEKDLEDEDDYDGIQLPATGFLPKNRRQWPYDAWFDQGDAGEEDVYYIEDCPPLSAGTCRSECRKLAEAREEEEASEWEGRFGRGRMHCKARGRCM